MTNHESFAKITGKNEPLHEEAVGMLLERIRNDYEEDTFEENFSSYPALYRAMYSWLNEPAPKESKG